MDRLGTGKVAALANLKVIAEGQICQIELVV